MIGVPASPGGQTETNLVTHCSPPGLEVSLSLGGSQGLQIFAAFLCKVNMFSWIVTTVGNLRVDNTYKISNKQILHVTLHCHCLKMFKNVFNVQCCQKYIQTTSVWIWKQNVIDMPKSFHLMLHCIASCIIQEERKVSTFRIMIFLSPSSCSWYPEQTETTLKAADGKLLSLDTC